MSVNEITTQITNVLDESGLPYSNYKCKQVSWDDVSRYGAGTSNLSCVGSNITDTRLYAKDSRLLYTVRPNNWNERIGIVSSDKIRFVYNNKLVTLKEYLEHFPEYAKYVLKGRDYHSLDAPETDTKVSVRFQTTFLPLRKLEKRIYYAPEVYTYGNQNVQLLCTSQGVSVQQGTSGRQKLFHHEVDDNQIKRYWFEAEATRFKVGETHNETVEEAKEALNRGKSMATSIGLYNDTPRMNTLMTIQIPIEKKMSGRYVYNGGSTNIKFTRGSSGMRGSRGGYGGCSGRYGKSSAGRVSRGTLHDNNWSGITADDIKRNTSQHCTVTIVLYHVIENGIPSSEDVKKSIDELETLYSKCDINCNLDTKPAEFMNGGSPQTFSPQIQPYNPDLVHKEISTDV